MIPIKDENPVSTFPIVTILLILANIVVFIYGLTLGPGGRQYLILSLGAVPYELSRLVDIHPQALVPLPLTLFTAMFVHAGFLHLGGNMLYLWIFGNNIEDYLGHAKFSIFYILTGLIASFAHILSDVGSRIPMVGASGAIAGVLGAYMVLYPRARIVTFVFFFIFIRLVELPAVFVLGWWFFLQLIGASAGGGVAWFAHIGGFVSGLFLVGSFGKRRPKYRGG